MTASTWNSVGGVPKISQAKNKVISGAVLPKAVALVTLILWIPSTQNIFERLRITSPFKISQGRAFSISAQINSFPDRNARQRMTGKLTITRINNIGSLEMDFLALCWK